LLFILKKITYKNLKKNTKRILAVTTGGLGDAILFSPVLHALRTINMPTHIEMLVASPLALEVYRNVKEISRISCVRSHKSSLFLRFVYMLPIVFRYLLEGRFDTGLFATGLNPTFGHLFKYTGCIKNTFFAPNYPEYETDLECNIALGRSINPKSCNGDLLVPLTLSSGLEAQSVSEEYGVSVDKNEIVAIYPSRELKHRPRWKIEKLLQVVKLLRTTGFSGKFVVVGSATEGNEWDRIDKGGIVDANLAGKLSILGSASFIKNCKLFIGNDGGLMHMAGALGCPLVAIMANTPVSYRPSGEKTTVIKSKLNCCNGIFPNRPKDCSYPKCAEAIEVREVYEACLEKLLKSYN
jgi:ADP-heptose:LPS heptosyltransferase